MLIAKHKRKSIFRTGAIAKNRLEAFSDGVLAFVITLLVLEVKLPPDLGSETEIWNALVRLAPAFLAWVVSFVFVLVFWVNHHYLIASLKHADRDAMGRAAGTMAPSSLQRINGAPHERPEPIPYPPRSRPHADRRNRDESIELARRRHCSRHRAPSAEEASTERSGVTAFADAMACGSNQNGPHDHAHRRCVRGRPRRILACALASGPRRRSPRHPPDERGCIARASPR